MRVGKPEVHSLVSQPSDRPHSSYAAVARLGLIVPPTNTVNEAEWQLLLRELDGITLHVTRMALHLDTRSSEGRRALLRDLRHAVEDLDAAGPDAIAYGCTVGSLDETLHGLTDYMQSVSHCACVAAASSLVHAARALDMRRVVLATPYDEIITRHETEYLALHGIDVLHASGLGIGAGGAHEYINIARIPERQVIDHCLAAWRGEADGLIVSCTDFATLRVVPLLEEQLGKPVVSSNLATFWCTLRAAGVSLPLRGYGGLLQL